MVPSGIVLVLICIPAMVYCFHRKQSKKTEEIEMVEEEKNEKTVEVGKEEDKEEKKGNDAQPEHIYDEIREDAAKQLSEAGKILAANKLADEIDKRRAEMDRKRAERQEERDKFLGKK